MVTLVAAVGVRVGSFMISCPWVSPEVFCSKDDDEDDDDDDGTAADAVCACEARSAGRIIRCQRAVATSLALGEENLERREGEMGG